MAKKATRSAKRKPRTTQSEQERIDARAALKRAVWRERDIRRLSTQLDRALAASNVVLVEFAKRVIRANGFEAVSKLSPNRPVEGAADAETITAGSSRDMAAAVNT